MAEKSPTIFVIDDDDSVRKSLARLLRSAGLTVETFPSGEAYLERQPYDGLGCIVLDVCMAGLSGTDLQARLAEKRLRPPHHLPHGARQHPHGRRRHEAGRGRIS